MVDPVCSNAVQTNAEGRRAVQTNAVNADDLIVIVVTEKTRSATTGNKNGRDIIKKYFLESIYLGTWDMR